MKRTSKKKGKIKEFPVDLSEIYRLIKVYDSIEEAILLKTSKDQDDNEENIFSTSNIVGEYAEILVCEKLGYCQSVASNSGYDCVGQGGEKIQIKSRLCKSDKKSGDTEMGIIGDNALNRIDYVIVILFDKQFEIKCAYKIKSNIYMRLARNTKRGYKLILNNKNVEKIRHELGNGIEDIKNKLSI